MVAESFKMIVSSKTPISRFISFNRLFQLSVAVGASWFSGAAFAINFYYNIDRPQSLVECDQRAYVGEIEEAQNCYTDILQAADDHSNADRAMAAEALGDFKQANRLFRDATSDEQGAAVSTGWGRLYLRTHQVG